jgi:hypothetical protein
MGTDPALIIYDGECVFCNNYLRFVRLRETIGKVDLLDARSDDPRVKRYWREGFDLNEGMLFRLRRQHLPRLRGGVHLGWLVERKFGSKPAQPRHLLKPCCVPGALPVPEDWAPLDPGGAGQVDAQPPGRHIAFTVAGAVSKLIHR